MTSVQKSKKLTVNFKSLRVKSAIPMFFLTLCFVLSLGVEEYLISKKDKVINDFSLVFTPALVAVLNADRDIYQALSAQQAALYAADYTGDHEADFRENAQQVFQRINQFNQLLEQYPDARAETSEFEPYFKQWKLSGEHFFELIKQDTRRADLLEALAQSQQHFIKLRSLLDRAGELLNQSADKNTVSVEAHVNKVQWFITIFIVITLISSILLTYFVSRSFSNQLLNLSKIIYQIAHGEGI